jgi:hypothetical protein
MKKLLLNFIVSLFCLLLAVAQVLATEYTEAANDLQVEWVAGDGTDVYNFTGDNVQAIRSERGFATVNITGTGSVVADNCSEHGCPGQYFNGQFTDAFAGADATTLAQHYPPWYGIRYPSTASNCALNGGGAVSCDHVAAPYSNATDYKFKKDIVYSIDMTIDAGTKAGVYFKAADTTAGTLDLVEAYVDLATNKVELKKYVNNTATTPLSAAVTYVAGATLKLISADGIKWIVVYNGSQVGTEQTLSEASLDSSVAGFFATSVATTFDNWKAGRWQLGPELVTNGDGESFTGWNATNADLSAIVSGGAIGNCFKIFDSADASPYIVQVITLAQGKQYSASLRSKVGTAGVKYLAYLGSFSFPNIYINPTGAALDSFQSTWTKNTKVITTTPAEADVLGAIAVVTNAEAGTQAYGFLDEISIREIQ